jgi:quercetin dioxygenase-like cupin family protein
MRKTHMLGIAWFIGASFIVAPAIAQNQNVTRAVLQSIEFPGDRYMTESVLVTVAPQAVVGRHTHPGVEMGYLLSGAGTLSIDGQPVRSLKAGDTWAIPEGVVHALRNTGDQPERIVATYVIEKSKPLATVAP